MQAISSQRDLLGECPRWHQETQTLWWVDILKHQIHSHQPNSGVHGIIQLKEEIGCFIWCEQGGLLVGTQSGLSLIKNLSKTELIPIASPEADKPWQRFNDGRCDPAGRFIAGTQNPRKDESFGTFYQLNHQLQLRPLIGKSWTCNGLAFSPDGKTLYWSDTPNQTIYACDYDVASGNVGNQRTFYVVPKEWGRPDGATVDSAGNYWSAQYAGGRVLCISPQGKLLKNIELPVTNPTMPCFGGHDLNILYITSASQKMTEEHLQEHPMEGAVLALPVDIPGLPEVKFAG
jgi:sugar lactone lactonase YvrE